MCLGGPGAAPKSRRSRANVFDGPNPGRAVDPAGGHPGSGGAVDVPGAYRYQQHLRVGKPQVVAFRKLSLGSVSDRSARGGSAAGRFLNAPGGAATGTCTVQPPQGLGHVVPQLWHHWI